MNLWEGWKKQTFSIGRYDDEGINDLVLPHPKDTSDNTTDN
jgi:hypothetical protein